MDLEQFKQVFILKRETILASLNRGGEEIDVDGDEIDEASAGELGSLAASLSKRNLKQLQDIERALMRIEEGTFGECEECGEPIGEKRLLAKPDVITCIGCAERLEHLKKQFAR